MPKTRTINPRASIEIGTAPGRIKVTIGKVLITQHHGVFAPTTVEAPDTFDTDAAEVLIQAIGGGAVITYGEEGIEPHPPKATRKRASASKKRSTR